MTKPDLHDKILALGVHMKKYTENNSSTEKNNLTENQEFYIAHIAEMKEVDAHAWSSPFVLTSLLALVCIGCAFVNPWTLFGILPFAITSGMYLKENLKYKEYFNLAKISKREYKNLVKSGEISNIRRRVVQREIGLLKKEGSAKTNAESIETRPSRTTMYLNQPKKEIIDPKIVSTRKGRIDLSEDSENLDTEYENNENKDGENLLNS